MATRKEQLAALHNIAANAKINGVVLQYLTAHMAQEKEPALACHGALLSPETGIIDSHALMLALQADAERAGAQFVFHTPCTGGQIRGQAGFELTFGADSSTKLRCSLLVNAAGLDATNLARNIRGLPATAIAPTFFCKGSYFTLNGRSPFSHLIYPLPNTAGLGIHLTLDLGGQARFGPDVEWVTQADYTVHVGKRDAFSNAVREYWPGLPDEALAPGYAGIRPKIAGPGHTFSDFVISGPQDHGIAGLVNLFGIESPGLTASLAIADVVAELLK